MLRFIKSEWKFFAILILGVILFAVIYYEYKNFISTYRQTQQVQQPYISINTAGEKSKPGETQVVYLKGDSTVTKEVVYVPKEVDPATGKLEKTDVQFERKQNKVFVKINGKEYEVPAEVKEDVKFDKGKLVVTEQTETKINITAPKPSFNLGVGWSKNGAAVEVNGPLFKNVSWWAYGDKKTVSGGLQFPILK